MTHDESTREELRRRLLARRHTVVELGRGAKEQLQAMERHERVKEVEEDAQGSSAAFVLGRLSDDAGAEVARIDAALARLEAGSYGVCVDCGGDIPVDRLLALPYTLLDFECSAAREAGSRHPSL